VVDLDKEKSNLAGKGDLHWNDKNLIRFAVVFAQN
jgi:hypothetical protein